MFCTEVQHVVCSQCRETFHCSVESCNEHYSKSKVIGPSFVFERSTSTVSEWCCVKYLHRDSKIVIDLHGLLFVV